MSFNLGIVGRLLFDSFSCSSGSWLKGKTRETTLTLDTSIKFDSKIGRNYLTYQGVMYITPSEAEQFQGMNKEVA